MSEPTRPSGNTPTPRLQDSIRQALEQDLRDGRLAPGMAIDEAALCSRFRVSRTPVREALLLLSARGLIDIAPRSGIFVRRLAPLEVVGMMEGLAELEAVLARLAAMRIADSQRSLLHAALERTGRSQRAQDPEAYALANAELHGLIYEAGGNAYVADLTRELRLRIAPYRRRLFDKPGRLQKSQAEHAAVVEAIVLGKPALAADLMRDHIWAGGQVLADALLSASR
jgi:DNA-binding GntR family transcriptional regulator